MNVFGMIILIVLAVAAVASFIVGFIKRFDKVRSWALEYLLASLLSIGIGGAVSKSMSATPAIAGVVGIIIPIAFILLMILAFKLIKIPFAKQRAKAETATDVVPPPVKKFSLFKLFSRLLGGISKMLQAVVVVGVIAVCVIAVLDLSQFAAVQTALGSLLSSPLWQFAKDSMMDFLTVGILYLCIKSGYSSGVSGALWALIMVALVGVAALISYNLAFKVEAFGQAAQNLSANVSVLSEQIAHYVIMAGIFVVLLVPVVIAGIFVPRLLSGARDGKVFYAIDGALGAFFALVLAIGMLMVIGNIVGSVSEFDFMKPLNAYFENTAIAKYFYNENVLAAMDVKILPLDQWLAPAPAEPLPADPEPAACILNLYL